MNLSGGIQIIKDRHLVKNVETIRSWKERLLSFPWRPFRKYKVTTVPDPFFYKIDLFTFAAHPDTAGGAEEILKNGGLLQYKEKDNG